MAILLQFVLFRKQIDYSEELHRYWSLLMVVNSSITQQVPWWANRYHWWLNILEATIVARCLTLIPVTLYHRFDKLGSTFKLLSVLLAFMIQFFIKFEGNLVWICSLRYCELQCSALRYARHCCTSQWYMFHFHVPGSLFEDYEFKLLPLPPFILRLMAGLNELFWSWWHVVIILLHC